MEIFRNYIIAEIQELVPVNELSQNTKYEFD